MHAFMETTWPIVHDLSSLAIGVPKFPASGIDTRLDQALNMMLAGIRSRDHTPVARN